jgi:hypothetical protein
MSDRSSHEKENVRTKVAPPKGKKAAADKAATNDKPADRKDTKQPAETKDKLDTANRDTNGFPKPDFSEMEKSLEIIRYEYEFGVSNRLNIVAKVKKPNSGSDWRIEFFDADGAQLTPMSRVYATSGTPQQIGEVVKLAVGAPSEKQMRDEVKKIISKMNTY